jgi:hypothetical protein
VKKLKTKKWFVYLVSALVSFISFLLAYLLPIEQIFRGFVAIPGTLALCATIYKAWKDEYMQNKQQDFILGTASHMAEVAYDRHVLFCEEYVERLQRGLQEIYRDGASKNSMDIGRQLVNIRQKYSAWLTKKIEDDLRPIEEALIEIGAKEHLLDYQGVGEERNKTVERVYSLLDQILGHKKGEDDLETKMAIEDVIEIIREILGINALTELRIEATKLAVNRLKK